MKSLVLLVTLVAVVIARNENKIEVPGMNGAAYVSTEDLLEKALGKKLFPMGVLDVDVNEEPTIGTYKVTLQSSTGTTNTSVSLEQALKDLGFTDATVKSWMTGSTNRHYEGMKDSYLVTLNPSTMNETMLSFVKDTLSTTDLKVDNRYD